MDGPQLPAPPGSARTNRLPGTYAPAPVGSGSSWPVGNGLGVRRSMPVARVRLSADPTSVVISERRSRRAEGRPEPTCRAASGAPRVPAGRGGILFYQARLAPVPVRDVYAGGRGAESQK